MTTPLIININENDFYFIKKNLIWLECSIGFITDRVNCIYILPFKEFSDIYLVDVVVPIDGMKRLNETFLLNEMFTLTVKQTNENSNFKCRYVEKEGEKILPTGEYFFTWLKFTGVKLL